MTKRVDHDAEWSILSPLTPENYGSGDVEALTSYISGLSFSHSLKPSDLMANLILPRTNLNQDWTTSRRLFAHIVNGIGVYAEGVVRSIESLTKLQGLRSLTAIPWREFLNPRGNFLLKSARHWCPKCYKEMEERGIRGHDSLYWYLSPTRICAKHHQWLHSVCPKCRKQQPFFPKLPFIELCDSCGFKLSDVLQESNFDSRPVVDAQIWTSQCMRELVSRSFFENEPRPLEWRDKLIRLSQRHFDGKTYRFENALGVRRGQIRRWINTDANPSLELIADLCFRLNCPVGRFIFDTDELCDPTYWRRPGACDFRRPITRLSENQLKSIRCHLTELANGGACTLTDLRSASKHLGVSVSLLKYRFPDLCKEVTNQTRSRNIDVVLRRAEERRSRLLRAAQLLISDGRWPSHRQLRTTGIIKGGDLQYLAQIGGMSVLLKGR